MKTKKIKLTKDEQKIYDAILKSFPSTSHDSAYNYALQGGVKFEHYNR